MNGVKRFEKFRDNDFDHVMLLIKNGTIKCGRYAHRVKVDEKKKIPKEVFSNGRTENSSGE